MVFVHENYLKEQNILSANKGQMGEIAFLVLMLYVPEHFPVEQTI